MHGAELQIASARRELSLMRVEWPRFSRGDLAGASMCFGVVRIFFYTFGETYLSYVDVLQLRGRRQFLNQRDRLNEERTILNAMRTIKQKSHVAYGLVSTNSFQER